MSQMLPNFSIRLSLCVAPIYLMTKWLIFSLVNPIPPPRINSALCFIISCYGKPDFENHISKNTRKKPLLTERLDIPFRILGGYCCCKPEGSATTMFLSMRKVTLPSTSINSVVSLTSFTMP